MRFGREKQELAEKKWPRRAAKLFLERTSERRSPSPDEKPEALTLEQADEDCGRDMAYLLRADGRLPAAFVLELMEHMTRGMSVMVRMYEPPVGQDVRALLAEYGAMPHRFLAGLLRSRAAAPVEGEQVFGDETDLAVAAHGLPRALLTALYLDPLQGVTVKESVAGIPEPVELPQSLAELERLFAERSVIWMEYRREVLEIGIPDAMEGERAMIGALRAFCAARAVELRLLWPEGE